MLTKNRVTTVAMAVATVVALYQFESTRDMLFPRGGGWFS